MLIDVALALVCWAPLDFMMDWIITPILVVVASLIALLAAGSAFDFLSTRKRLNRLIETKGVVIAHWECDHESAPDEEYVGVLSSSLREWSKGKFTDQLVVDLEDDHYGEPIERVYIVQSQIEGQLFDLPVFNCGADKPLPAGTKVDLLVEAERPISASLGTKRALRRDSRATSCCGCSIFLSALWFVLWLLAR